MSDFSKKKCVPCEGGIPRMSISEIEMSMKSLDQWEHHRINGVDRLEKMFKFSEYMRSSAFCQLVAQLSDQEDHHPELLLTYHGLKVQIYTHAVGGLTENDFILATKIDQLKNSS